MIQKNILKAKMVLEEKTQPQIAKVLGLSLPSVSKKINGATKFSIEEIIIASNANVGGPTSAAAMAVSKGWTELIVPALLIGTLGYVIGNYYGIFTGWMLH